MSKYTIKSGDTLSQIAKNNGVTVKDLMAANPGIKDPNKIYAGQSINLSGGSSSGSEKPSGGSSSTVKPTSNKKPATASSGFTYDDFSYDDFSYEDYKESDTVTQAYAALQSHLASKPGEFQDTWQGKVNSIIDQILNREAFSYDVNSDALYQQYKDQYMSLGKLAMTDTMGQAAAMTGGYGNSYASTAGNQAYQSYLSQLNSVVPELHGMALDKYFQEGDALYNQYSLLADQQNQEYGRYQDDYNRWFSELGLYNDQYNNERSLDYNMYADKRDFTYGTYSDGRNFAYGVHSDDKNLAYNEYRNAIADEQWQKQYDESVRQNNIANNQWQLQFDETVRQNNADMSLRQEQWDLEKAAYADSKYSYSGTTASGESYNNGSLTNAQIKELQAALGVKADGYFGRGTREAADGLSANAAYKKYVLGEIDGEEETVGYITDMEQIQEWSDGILNADTESEAIRYVERLEQLDPNLADSLYEQWLEDHGEYPDKTDTTVTPLPQYYKGTTKKSGIGGGKFGLNYIKQ